METPFEQIQKSIEAGKIGGSWLITGGFETEQKQFIQEVCSYLLKQDLKDIAAFHPDLKWIECGLTEEAKKEIQKNILAGKAIDEAADFAHKQEITVDDIRTGIQFLSLKTAPDKWRILIISPADKMNENAANALLKALEEPSERSIIFLLCRNMGRILPTIKSRCRKIRLKPLSERELSDKIKELYPGLGSVETIVALSEGSMGLAQMICDNDGVNLYQELVSLLQPAVSVEAVKSFVAGVTENDESFYLAKKFILSRIYQEARSAVAVSPFMAEDYMDLYQEAEGLFRDIDRIYLDKKEVLQSIIFKVSEALS
ncbi:MAG: hypothetical protein IKS41_03055 [Alphaproteobacteria bacterium]|nr:hypothetical protein [Alphaproteobacteria bacterium]